MLEGGKQLVKEVEGNGKKVQNVKIKVRFPEYKITRYVMPAGKEKSMEEDGERVSRLCI